MKRIVQTVVYGCIELVINRIRKKCPYKHTKCYFLFI